MSRLANRPNLDMPCPYEAHHHPGRIALPTRSSVKRTVCQQGYPEAVRRAVEVFNLLNIKPMRPALLAVAAKFASKDAAQAFQFLILLGIQLLIASAEPSIMGI